jgi:photosystem II stability/assembly factor-like uncharacterized protein
MTLLRARLSLARLSFPCALLCALPWSPPARAAIYSWRNVVIGGGGYVTGIEYHPRQAGLAYARTDVGGAYRRDKPGGPWIALNDAVGGPGNEFMHLGVLTMALDPSDASRIYLACGQYTAWWAPAAVLMASADRGATWTTAELPFRLGGNQDGRGTGERLVVDPSDGARLLLGTTQDGLWRSSDRGTTWSRIAGFPAASTTFVRFDPARPGTVFAGAAQTAGPSVWKSTNGGDSWAAVPGQPEGLIALQTALDAGGNFYLTFADAVGPSGAGKGALWKLSPEGSWENLNVPGGGGGYGGVATDRNVPGRIVVSTLDRWWPGDEIYRSDDGGKTWSGILTGSELDHASAPWAASLKPHWITDVEIDPFIPGRATFVTGYGLFSTGKSGVSGDKPAWVFDNNGIEECVPLGLVSPASGPPLVSVIGDFDGFRHDDLGTSSPSGRHTPHHGTSQSLDGAGMAPGVLAKLHGATGSISRDGGRTWKDFPSAPPAANGGQIAVSSDGSRLVWCPKEGIPFLSKDDGATWAPSTGCPSGKLWPAADRVNRLHFYLYDAGTRRVHRSDDGGATFGAMEGELPEGGLRIEPVPGHAGHLWHAAGKGGLWRSADGGAKFHQAASVDGAYQVGFGKPAPGKRYPAVFLWGRVGGVEGIFRSDDAGKGWHRINDDRHRFGAINDITGDPRVFGRVYLGTSGRGVIVGEQGIGADSP